MTRCSLRRAWVVAALLLTVGVVFSAATQTASARTSRWTDIVWATLVGDAYVSGHNGTSVTDVTAGAFFSDASIPVDGTHTPIVLLQGDEVTSFAGNAVEQYTDPVNSCSMAFDLLEQRKPNTRTSEGLLFWNSQTPGVFPDPGQGNVRVTADPLFADWVRLGPVSRKCWHTSAGQLQSVAALWKRTFNCVLEAKDECSQTIRMPKTVVSCGQNCSTTYRAYAQMEAHRVTLLGPTIIPPLLHLLNDVLLRELDLFPPYSPMYIPPLPIPLDLRPQIPTIIPKVPDDGEIDGQVTMGKQDIVSIKQHVKKGTSVRLPLAWVKAGALAVQHLKAPAVLTLTATFKPVQGKPLTITAQAYVQPATNASAGGGSGGGSSSGRAITSVAFTGSAANPTVVVRGKNLGARPAPSPPQHPAGLNGCPQIANDTGYDYGTSLYLVVPAKGWSGGRYRPSANETDCIDLVVTKFTPTEVDFHFGPFYTSLYPKFALSPGTQAQVFVNGASATTTVKYG